MSIEQLDQNNKLIGTKQIVTAKQSKVGALLGPFRVCFKTQLYDTLLRQFALFLTNYCAEQVVPSQISTMAHKTE